MKAMFSLDRLLPGEEAVVEYISTKELLPRRLTDLGFVRGGRVRCRMQSAGGDPTAYQIRGTLIALRKADAGRIIVSQERAAAPWD